MHFIVLSYSSGVFSAVQFNEQTKTLSSLSPLVSKSKTYTQRVSRAPVLELHYFLRSLSCWRKTWLLMCCFLPSFLQFSLFPDSKVSIESDWDWLVLCPNMSYCEDPFISLEHCAHFLMLLTISLKHLYCKIFSSKAVLVIFFPQLPNVIHSLNGSTLQSPRSPYAGVLLTQIWW